MKNDFKLSTYFVSNIEVLKPKKDNLGSEYTHSFSDDDDDMDDYDEVPKSHHRWH